MVASTVHLRGGKYDGAVVDLPIEDLTRFIAVCVWTLDPGEVPPPTTLPRSAMHGTRITVFDDLARVPMFEGTYLKGPDGIFYRPSILPTS